MENREDRNQKALSRPLPAYAHLYFDHLYSEFLSLKPSIVDYGIVNLVEELHQKRLKDELTWSDIYSFDLALVDVRPAESLIRKAFDSRARYRSVAGQKEYDEYLASKPMDLGSIPVDPDADPPKPNLLIERELRADIRYLLSKFYLYYALLPVREELRDRLTKRAVLATTVVVFLGVLFLVLNMGGSLVIRGLDQYLPVVVTVLTVMLAGIVGGCVSMLQRIQTAPSEGDALYNLAALTSGWRGIMLAPLYGGIFACVLFVLFAGGILNGSVFPTIVTPSRRVSSVTASPSPVIQNAASPAPSPAPTAAPTESPQPPVTGAPNSSSPPVVRTEAQTPETPASGPSAAQSRSSVLQVKDFLRETGPSSGVAYALLIIWSFLAGFAERLVPDTLNRLVQKNIDTQGKG